MRFSNLFRHLNIFRHRAMMKKHPGFAESVSNAIFVVGCGHSGTTLLLRVIGSHPKIHAILDESATFTKDRTYQLRDFDMAALAAGKKRWVEKTPLHIHHIGSMFKWRPKARVIIILRDGRDVAASIKKRKENFETGVNRWVRDNAAGEKWWQDPRVMVLKYEDLVTDFDGKVREVIDFLGEEYCEEMGNFHQGLKHEAQPESRPESAVEGNHFQYRMWQVSQPLFDGRGRWMEELDQAEKDQFMAKAGDMLIRYGYAEPGKP